MRTGLFIAGLFLCLLALSGSLLAENADRPNQRYDFSAHKREKDRKAAETDTNAPNVVDFIFSDPDFSTLSVALQKSGLDKELRARKASTVFAPSNDAFASLPAGELDRLFKEENKQELIHLLKLHILHGPLDYVSANKGETYRAALSDDLLTITKAEDGLSIGPIHVIKADIKTSSGFIHVTDRVMMPSEQNSSKNKH